MAALVLASRAGSGLQAGTELAPIVVAAAVIYLAAALLRRREAAWPVFGATFVAMVVLGIAVLVTLA